MKIYSKINLGKLHDNYNLDTAVQHPFFAASVKGLPGCVLPVTEMHANENEILSLES